MTKRSMRVTLAGTACISLLLSACGGVKLWPFGDDYATPERPRAPPNSTEYGCAANRHFFVRTLEGGAAVWLILPERELRLERLGAGGETRYAKGDTLLEINGNSATLKDGTAVVFADCKSGGSEPGESGGAAVK